MNSKGYTELPNIINNQNAIDVVTSDKKLTYYTYNNTPVPRVSKILDMGIGKGGLVDWAARVGWKRMNSIREGALVVGTIVHEMIGHHLLTNTDKEVNFSNYDLTEHNIRQVINSYNNYKKWRKRLLETGSHIDKVIGIEVPVSCPWYGGTIDAIMVINGATYVIDFKTSKQISNDYLLQVCAYAWIINSGYCPLCDHVDGVGILRFDKAYQTAEEYFLNYHNPVQNQFLFDYTRTFWAVCNSFYNLAYTNRVLYETLGEDEYEIQSIGDRING